MIYVVAECDAFSGEESPYIKIGYATGVDKSDGSRRANDLQCGNPRRLIVIGMAQGDVPEEKALHARFKAWRIACPSDDGTRPRLTEWFRLLPCSDLSVWVDSVRVDSVSEWNARRRSVLEIERLEEDKRKQDEQRRKQLAEAIERRKHDEAERAKSCGHGNPIGRCFFCRSRVVDALPLVSCTPKHERAKPTTAAQRAETKGVGRVTSWSWRGQERPMFSCDVYGEVAGRHLAKRSTG